MQSKNNLIFRKFSIFQESHELCTSKTHNPTFNVFFNENDDYKANFYQIMFWTIPAMCVQCWIEKFNQNCKTHQVLYTCRYYQKLSAAFSYFLFLFYFILQLLSIMHIFMSISKFVQKETSFPEYVMFSGFMLSLGEVGNKKI